MRYIAFQDAGGDGLAVEVNGVANGLTTNDPSFPGNLDALVPKGVTALAAAADILKVGRKIDLSARSSSCRRFRTPPKIICVGLNYRDHSAESGFKQPDYPTLFTRFHLASSATARRSFARESPTSSTMRASSSP